MEAEEGPLPGPLAALLRSFERSSVMVGLFDAQDHLRWANAAYDEVFLHGLALPVAFADVLRHGFARRFGVHIDCGDVEQFLRSILPRRRSTPSRSFQTDTADGRWLWFTETLLDDGWLLTVASDVTPLKLHERRIALAHEQALHESLTDALTGVPNRRHILQLAEEAMRARRHSELPLCMALIDIDHFKRVNDTRGHDVGDEVLRAFCQAFRDHLRPNDATGRMGGEEFLVLLRGVAIDEATMVIERLRARVAERMPVPVTFSAGLAQARDSDDVAAVIKRADAALYVAKRGGRDRVVRGGAP